MLLLTIYFILSMINGQSLEERLIGFDPSDKIKSIDQEISFWENKLEKHPDQIPYHAPLAKAYTLKYETTSSIEDLKKAENLLASAIQKTPKNQKSVLLRSIAQNLIKQHRFCEALDFMLQADTLGDNERANDLILFDIYHEIRNDEASVALLSKIGTLKDFNFLIRKAKLQDSRGHLERAIQLMELAKENAIKTKNISQQEWVLANLGDFYGHAGKIKHAAHFYHQTLEINPNNWYALKGLAWIAYSDEKDYLKASRIVQHIAQYNNSPDLLLLAGELNIFADKKEEAQKAHQNFILETTNDLYGSMYNKYLIELYTAKEYSNLDAALQLARHEVQERPTAESYDLLAYVFYKKGEHNKARNIVYKEVLGKTSEPHVLLHLLEILRDNPDVRRNIMQELESSSFEIGPLNTQKLLS